MKNFRKLMPCLALVLICESVIARESQENKNVAEETEQDCVILLHGLARTSKSMKPLYQALTGDGYFVVNNGYDSTNDTIENLANTSVPAAIAQCPVNSTVHFVTHSMGGILVRYYLANHTLPHPGNVVMLGPPNRGSEVVDTMGGVPGFQWINGPAGNELGTDENSTPNTLPPVNFPLGIIAGNATFNPILSGIIPAEDDGKVSVERTKVEGMLDHIVLDTSHTFMMRNKDVIAQTLYFLRNKHFNKKEQPD